MKHKRLISTALTTLLCLALITSCTDISDAKPPAETSGQQSTTTQEPPAETSATEQGTGSDEQETSETAPPEPEESYCVHLVCAGDNLIHNAIYNQANARAGGDGYDFSYVYEKVIKYIEPADLAVLNQETIVTDAYPPSNYPMFCSPEALGDYMVDVVGFDAVSMSNNHVLDKGESGLVATLDYWDVKHPDIVRYGAYRSEEDMNDIRLMEVNGITFAFLGYMEHTNGLVNPGTMGTRLVYLSELDTIEQQIRRADELADVVIVSPHFGIEVTNIVTDQQRELSRKFVEWGADIIIGTQPHTIQECGWIEREDGTKGFVYYCLGNFVSAMSDPLGMIGGIGDLYIEMDPVTREITITDPKLIPIISHFEANFRNVTIYPFLDYTEALASVHHHGLSMEYINKALAYVPEEFLSIE